MDAIGNDLCLKITEMTAQMNYLAVIDEFKRFHRWSGDCEWSQYVVLQVELFGIPMAFRFFNNYERIFRKLEDFKLFEKMIDEKIENATAARRLAWFLTGFDV